MTLMLRDAMTARMQPPSGGGLSAKQRERNCRSIGPT